MDRFFLRSQNQCFWYKSYRIFVKRKSNPQIPLPLVTYEERMVDSNKHGVQCAVSILSGNISFPSQLDHICWFVLFLSAISIRHKTIELFIWLVSCYSEAAVGDGPGLDTGTPSQLTALLESLPLDSSNQLSLIPHQHSAVSFTELFIELLRKQELKNNTASLLLTSYWNSCNHIISGFSWILLLLFIWHIMTKAQTTVIIKIYFYSFENATWLQAKYWGTAVRN